MNRLSTLTALMFATVSLAGCEMQLPGAMQDPAEAAAPEVPAEVAAALPPGVPASIVFQTADGCYAYAIEVTEPMQGFRLRDRNGNVVCPPGSTPSEVIASAPETTS